MMRKRKGDNGKGNRKAPACPYCGAGADGTTLGLTWDYIDHCWHCVICGYRDYEQPRTPKTRAEIMAEKIWDQINFMLDKEMTRSPHP
jgi:rubredoxin